LTPLTKVRFTNKAARLEKELRKRKCTFHIRRNTIAINYKHQFRHLSKNMDLEQRSQFVNQLKHTKAITVVDQPSQISYVLTAVKRREQFKQKSAVITALEARATANVHFDGRLEV
jgi:hypothetical protein